MNSKNNFLCNPIFCNHFRRNGSSNVLTRGDSSFDRVVISSERHARISALYCIFRERNEAVRKVKEEQRTTARMGGSLERVLAVQLGIHASTHVRGSRGQGIHSLVHCCSQAAGILSGNSECKERHGLWFKANTK